MSGRLARAWSAAALGLLAAAGPYLLPGEDGRLPGGSMPWQLACAGLACLAAGYAWRTVHGRQTRAARIVRAATVTAGMLVAIWAMALGLLWLLWPR